jgi:hypothetical protein
MKNARNQSFKCTEGISHKRCMNVTSLIWRNVEVIFKLPTYFRVLNLFFVLLTVHLDNLCNENQLNALPLIYFINQPLQVSAKFTAHHQEEFTVYVQQLVRVIRLSEWQLASSRSTQTYNT